MEKIRFRNLSVWMKIAVIGGIVYIANLVMVFLIEFVNAYLGVI